LPARKAEQHDRGGQYEETTFRWNKSSFVL
jgi:hypothetical protein